MLEKSVALQKFSYQFIVVFATKTDHLFYQASLIKQVIYDRSWN